MASLNTNQDALFISPDHLMIDHQLGDVYQNQQAGEAAAQPDQQCRPFPIHGGQPSPSFSDWNSNHQQSFRLSLPPTPSSPFPPTRPLTEHERLAFPCLGGPQDCWNLQLCPKHRQYPATPPERDYAHSNSQQTTAHDPRRQSIPATSTEKNPDPGTRNKVKRHITDPDDTTTERTFSQPPNHHHHHPPPRDTRTSISRGRLPHNLVERRYRDNLNHQIESLRLTLPSLRDIQPCTTTTMSPGSTDYDDLSLSSPRMPSKAVIIQTAAAYIQDMQSERTRLLDANSALQEQVRSLQQLVMRCGEDSSGGGSVLRYVDALRGATGTAAAGSKGGMGL